MERPWPSRIRHHTRQSAAAPSPFSPIADHAFLSDCHTGALIAPDGSVGWLCVPSFDSPSVFGTLLDRQAGYFRLGPFGIHHPTARAYEPGTNVLVTTWKTPTGWIEVRDALTMGPHDGEDEVTPHTRPPADDDADHLLVRTVRCLDGTVEVELVCEPVFDYGRVAGRWTMPAGTGGTRPRRAGRPEPIGLQTDLALGVEGDRVRARRVLRPATRSTARCRGRRRVVRRCPTSTTPGAGLPPHRASGAPGWTGPACPTIAGATRSSVPRW